MNAWTGSWRTWSNIKLPLKLQRQLRQMPRGAITIGKSPPETKLQAVRRLECQRALDSPPMTHGRLLKRPSQHGRLAERHDDSSHHDPIEEMPVVL
ncbi:MAG: hypothetical protein HUU20_14695 [Pirellulales bacterium]|nr:hypothetical protein [Pirellulales bacterium]